MVKLRIGSLLILLIILMPTHVKAEVASVDLVEMYSHASFVGVVHEDGVSRISSVFESLSDRLPSVPLFWRKTGHANVREIWKGSSSRHISYRASPSWACDESTAAAGTDAVVFLDTVYVFGLEIAWAGRGRYPLLNDGPTICINIRDARLPQDLVPKVILKPNNGYTEKLLRLEDLKSWCLVHRR